MEDRRLKVNQIDFVEVVKRKIESVFYLLEGDSSDRVNAARDCLTKIEEDLTELQEDLM